MKPYQIRVVDEKQELDAKIEKLECFVSTQTFLDLSSEERARMMRQYSAMKAYSEILGERISAFE